MFQIVDFSCLFGIDKYDCGGLKATAFYVKLLL